MTLESLDIQQQKLNELKNIFPEIFEDGKINHEKLKVILGDSIDDSSEHYSFSWHGKRACYKTIKAKTNATLKVDSDKSMRDGENVFIEGDNLEVLKLLQSAYHKKVKMIYIDPPYNKDKDFVYSDTWGDSIQNYLIQTDQLRDEERIFYFSFDKLIEGDIVYTLPSGVKLNLRENLDLEVL